jgi:hypothetical protein
MTVGSRQEARDACEEKLGPRGGSETAQVSSVVPPKLGVLRPAPSDKSPGYDQLLLRARPTFLVPASTHTLSPRAQHIFSSSPPSKLVRTKTVKRAPPKSELFRGLLALTEWLRFGRFLLRRHSQVDHVEDYS